MTKRIIFTGGGTAGHVTVNLTLIPHFLREGWEVSYIGSEQGIERQLIEPLSGVRYFAIATGKLRRYVDWQNLTDIFRVLKGVWQSYRVIGQVSPDVVFSKGGFVSVPVILGGRLRGVPMVIHESDLTPGLANRIAMPFATRICTTFPETGDYLGRAQVDHIGPVIREEMRTANPTRGLALCSLTREKPVLMVMGGSLGSQRLNQAIWENLSLLLERFQIVHICGKGNTNPTLQQRGYLQFEYVTDELPHMMAMADVVISRAGANAIFEFLFMRKPMLLIPLSAGASRGDQLLNAESFRKSGYAAVLAEEELQREKLLAALDQLYAEREAYKSRMESAGLGDARQKVIEIITAVAHRRG